MPLSDFQRQLCRILGEERKRSGESYVAGGLALNELLKGRRLSKDIDLFHDTEEALDASWARDRDALVARGFVVEVRRSAPAFVDARVSRANETTVVQWVRDSAYRFFPLVEHPDLGLTLNPVDLATNKVLAMAGRRRVRDWIDTIHCHETVQPLGYLAWAAAGKDPGLSPTWIVEEAARARYSQEEVDEEHYEGGPPEASRLAATWRQAVEEARKIVLLLPPDRLGTVVFDGHHLARASSAELPARLAHLSFHQGRIRGAFPEIRETTPVAPTREGPAR